MATKTRPSFTVRALDSATLLGLLQHRAMRLATAATASEREEHREAVDAMRDELLARLT